MGTRMPVSMSAEMVQKAMANTRFREDEINALRRKIFMDGKVCRVDLKVLFDIDEHRRDPDPAWTDLFCDAVLQHVLEEIPPQGYLSEDNARWLMEAVGERHDARTDTELEALTRIVEKATQVPPFFAAFVLRQVKNAAIYSDGHTRQGDRFIPGAVDEADLRFIQRVIWGAGAEGRLAVSREEAEALFDIADATNGAPNVSAWNDFFARAVGNYLVGATGREAPDRQQALQIWHTDFDGLLAKWTGRALLAASWGELRKGPRGSFGTSAFEDFEATSAEANLAREKATIAAAKLEGARAEWLVDRIRRNGLVTGPEAALLDFVRREASDLAADVVALMPAENPFSAEEKLDGAEAPARRSFGLKGRAA